MIMFQRRIYRIVTLWAFTVAASIQTQAADVDVLTTATLRESGGSGAVGGGSARVNLRRALQQNDETDSSSTSTSSLQDRFFDKYLDDLDFEFVVNDNEEAELEQKVLFRLFYQSWITGTVFSNIDAVCAASDTLDPVITVSELNENAAEGGSSCIRNAAGDTGNWVCRTLYDPVSGIPSTDSVCAVPDVTLETDQCGCCNGVCPGQCVCPCNLIGQGGQGTGFLVALASSSEQSMVAPQLLFGGERCMRETSAIELVARNDRFTCVTTCSQAQQLDRRDRDRRDRRTQNGNNFQVPDYNDFGNGANLNDNFGSFGGNGGNNFGNGGNGGGNGGDNLMEGINSAFNDLNNIVASLSNNTSSSSTIVGEGIQTAMGNVGASGSTSGFSGYFVDSADGSAGTGFARNSSTVNISSSITFVDNGNGNGNANGNSVVDNGAQAEINDLIDAVVDSVITLTGNTTTDTNVDGVLDAVNDIVNVVAGNTNTTSGDNANANVDGVQDEVNDIIDSLVDNVVNNGNSTGDNAAALQDAFDDIFDLVTANTTSANNANVDGVQDEVNDIVDAVVDNVVTGNTTSDNVGVLQDAVNDIVDAVGNTTSDNVGGVQDAVNDIIDTLVDNVVSGNTTLGNAGGVQDAVNDIIDAAGNTTFDNGGGVQDAINDIIDAVVDNVFTGIQDDRDTVLDQISDIQTAPELNSVFDFNVPGFVGDIFNGIDFQEFLDSLPTQFPAVVNFDQSAPFGGILQADESGRPGGLLYNLFYQNWVEETLFVDFSTCPVVENEPVCVLNIQGDTGRWACRTLFHPVSGTPQSFSVCADARRTLGTDQCGCCDGVCPTSCTCPCNLRGRGQGTGVLVRVDASLVSCMSPATALRFTERNPNFECIDDCSSV
jgi:hypothetical protein